MPANPLPKSAPTQHHACAIYCGAEGWLSVEELVERTDADIQRYKAAEPLKYRQSMLPRHPDGRRVNNWELRTPSPKQ